jgi:hypothetical protein|tara:strand:- start:4584 stop:4835 length:252 start_codon:yes stop_codon:yes gene_type:complete
MEKPMEQVVGSIYTFALFGSFLLGCLVTFVGKGYLDAYIDNAAYAKSITHPEMLDEDGSVDQSELLYLHFTDPGDTIVEDDDD